jgi:glycerophosphoryl diester phosphodiesterase
MHLLREVAASYRAALRFLGPFTLVHLALRLIVAALIVPITGLLLAGAIATSDQSALTDQDIVRFLLTPVGFIGVLAMVSLAIMASVLDVAVMTNAFRRQEHNPLRALASGLWLIIARFAWLFAFSALLVLRVLLIAAPFLLAGGAIALFALGDYDINYYLTYRPPEFLLAAGAIGVILLALAVVLISRLSSWAVSLHLLLFRKLKPRQSFRESATRLHGQRATMVGRILVWALVWFVLAALLAAVAGVLIAGVQELLGSNLRLVALATIVLLMLWSLANAVVSALCNGALSAMLDRIYRRVSAHDAEVSAPLADLPEAGARLPVSLLLAAALVLLGGGLYFSGGLLEQVSAERHVEIIAHRGAAGSRPENTLSAVEQALEEKADWVEIDVQESADGEVVVAHDSDFMKLAGVDLKVWDATMADLAEIDIGSWFDPNYAGERTPTLRDVLLTVRGRGKVIIELKYYGHDVELEARTARIVEDTVMADSVSVMSLKYPGIQKMHALRPDWPYGVLAATAIGNLAALEADFLAVNTGQVSLRLIRKAHAQGKKVYAWTVDDPLTMSRMISMGVDGLITNEPALARTVMEARNALSAPERLLVWLSDKFRLRSFDLVAEESDA